MAEGTFISATLLADTFLSLLSMHTILHSLGCWPWEGSTSRTSGIANRYLEHSDCVSSMLVTDHILFEDLAIHAPITTPKGQFIFLCFVFIKCEHIISACFKTLHASMENTPQNVYDIYSNVF